MTTTPSVPVSLVRALTLRCPRCGARGVLEHWLRLKTACPTCALALRDETEQGDWFGPAVVNTIAAELAVAAAMAAWVIWTFPLVPWNAVQVVAITVAILAPFVTMPFSLCLWVAVELMSGREG